MLKASVRGFMVRKKFSELRAEYVDLVAFLEKNKDVQVTWKTNKPCLPSLNYKRPGVRKIHERVSSGVDNQSENQEIDDVSLGCRRTSQSSPLTTERERGKFEEVVDVKEVCRVADTNFEVKQNIKEMQVPNYRLESQKNSRTDNPNDDITAEVCTSVGNGNKDNVLDQQDGLPVSQTNQQLIEGNVLNQEIKENMNSQGVKTRGKSFCFNLYNFFFLSGPFYDQLTATSLASVEATTL